MLSSHFDSTLPYAGSGSGGRLAVLLDPHQVHHRRYRPNVEVAPSCPRCDSPNTKFCYYNNYSLSQPRYFCKGCRRYWTKGGSLRNVPVGGGCRKNRRGKSSSSSSSSVAAAVARASPASVVGAAAFSHRRFPAGGAVRPDILLEGSVVGGPSGGDLGATQTTTVSAVDKPADGSAIDLALLYAKFLNRQPPTRTTTVENDQCDVVVVPDSVDTSSDTSLPNAADLPNSAVAPPDEPFFSSHDDGFGDLQTAALALRCPCPDDARAEPGFSVDQSCYESLAGLLATTDDGGDLVLPSTTTTMWHREAKYEPFDSLPEDALSAGAAADDVWGNALACQGLEAALCSRP